MLILGHKTLLLPRGLSETHVRDTDDGIFPSMQVCSDTDLAATAAPTICVEERKVCVCLKVHTY